MRVKHDFGNGRAVTFMGDIGGFNANTDLSWQVVLTLDCDGTFLDYDSTTSLGYKALGLRFEESTPNGTAGQDVVLHGPVAEFKLRW